MLTSAPLHSTKLLLLLEGSGSPMHYTADVNAGRTELVASSGNFMYIYVACSPSVGNHFMEHLTSSFPLDLQHRVLLLWCLVAGEKKKHSKSILFNISTISVWG